ncbi:hypothetical protein T265_06393 [Opisthorchis viverrini]|uniref:Uncharacterized protein n=1 Tax=Opisthorchis viverrini TaxID=6198 RepID=A0A074ZGL2_OPIVI|nr:hypothetical protein T265_06393 [Opisthorchis viverrini]KER26348.1 hypothetical protein T265_06393 [Opisthorchis viverrini]
MPPERSTRAGILPVCLSLDRGVERQRSGSNHGPCAVAPFWCLATMPLEGCTRAAILPDYPSLGRGNRDTTVLNYPDVSTRAYEQYALINWTVRFARILGRHWTRVSLLLELISSAYPMAVPGFEPRTSDMRGERVSTTLPTHVGRNGQMCSHLSDVRGSNPTSVSRRPLSRLGQPGSIPALVLPSGGKALRLGKGATAERLSKLINKMNDILRLFSCSGVSISERPHQREALDSNFTLIRAHQQCMSNGYAGIGTPDI